MPIALLLLILLSGGTSFVAQDSVPGDLLYPVKIHVNENVESLIALGDKQDAIVDVKQATRRLEEAQKLITDGKFTPEINTEIKNSFEDKVSNMGLHLRKLTGKGDSQFISEINDKLEVEVEDHFDTFSLVSADATNSPVFSDIFSRIDDRRKKGKGDDENKSITTSGTKMEDGEEDNKTSGIGSRDDSDDDNENESEDDDDNKGSVTTPTPVPTPTPTPTPTTPTSTTATSFTMAQVATHNKSTDCYSAISGGVYNLTSWINQHPGGASAIISLCGIDGTSAFMAQHGGQGNPAAELASLKIGILK